MASISTYLDTSRAKKNGEYPLKFSVSVNKGKRFFINLNIDVLSEQWNGYEVIRHNKKQLFNQYIRIKTTQVEDELMHLEFSGAINTLSVAQIKERIEFILIELRAIQKRSQPTGVNL